MADHTISVERSPRHTHVVGGGSSIEAIAGLGALVLAILAILGLAPLFFASIATIAAGAGLLIEGAAIAARYSRMHVLPTENRVETAELGSGVSTEFLGGIAGITLGILALLGVDPVSLLSVAVVVFGGSLLLGSSNTMRFASIPVPGEYGNVDERTSEAVRAGGGTQTLVGIGAIALGILALLGVLPLTLVLVGLICVGASLLLSGSAIAARMGEALGA